MKSKNIYLIHKALAPIFHSQPPGRNDGSPDNTTNTSYHRRIKIMSSTPTSVKLLETKAVSGNSVRGVGRRTFISLVLEELGFVKNKVVIDLPYALAETMLIGGTMSAGQGRERDALAKRYAEVYDKLPFYGLFGGSYKGVFFPGRLSVGFAYPLISGMGAILEHMDSPFTKDYPERRLDANDCADFEQRYARAALTNVEAERDTFGFLLARMADYPEFIERLTAAIDKAEENNKDKVDLKEVEEYILSEEGQPALEKLGQIFNVAPATTQTGKEAIIKKLGKYNKGIQSIFGVSGAIAAGTHLHQRISLLPGYGDDNLMETVFVAFVECVIARGYLGGMYTRGYGAVATEARVGTSDQPIPFTEASRAGEFWNWLRENKETIRKNLINFEKDLFGV